MISHYTAIVIISTFSLFTMIVCSESNHFTPTLNKRGFQLLFLAIIVANWAEWLAELLNGAPPRWIELHKFAKFTELSITPVVPILGMMTYNTGTAKKYAVILPLFNFIMQLSSLSLGGVFTIDSSNIYSRGVLSPAYVATFIIGTLILFADCLKSCKRYQYQNMVVLVLILLQTAFSMSIQFILPHLHLDWSFISITAIIFYVFTNQLEHQLDNTTLLLNRKSFDNAIEKLHKNAAVIFFDIDYFKNVNDKYGHRFGDECLVEISRIFKKVFDGRGHCYRYGGDEFCVILKKNPNHADALIKECLDRIEKLREKNSKMPMVSIGYAYFDPNKEKIYDTLKRADNMMYEYKSRHHKTYKY